MVDTSTLEGTVAYTLLDQVSIVTPMQELELVDGVTIASVLARLYVVA